MPERQPGADAGGEHFEFLFAARNGARGRVEFGVDIGRFEKPIAVSNRVQDVVEHASLPITEAFACRFAFVSDSEYPKSAGNVKKIFRTGNRWTIVKTT